MEQEKVLDIDRVEENAAEAEAAEQEAKAKEDVTSYTHVFKTTFRWKEREFTELTFDWSVLTGEDHLKIEDELLRRGRTLVTPAFTGDYLAGMAVKACTLREKGGKRVVTSDTMRKMPLMDFQRITRRARNFLLRAE